MSAREVGILLGWCSSLEKTTQDERLELVSFCCCQVFMKIWDITWGVQPTEMPKIKVSCWGQKSKVEMEMLQVRRTQSMEGKGSLVFTGLPVFKSKNFTSIMAPKLFFWSICSVSTKPVSLFLTFYHEELHSGMLAENLSYRKQWCFEVILHSSYWNPGQRGMWGGDVSHPTVLQEDRNTKQTALVLRASLGEFGHLSLNTNLSKLLLLAPFQHLA